MLRDFERNWQLPDNKMALANQFTDSGMFQYADDWLRGRPAIRMMLLGHGGALRLRAQAFAVEERSGHVAGAYAFYRDTVWVDQGRFLFVLQRTRGTRWRIAAANLTKTTPSPQPTRDPYSAADYIAELDSAGIQRGVVLSWAYEFAAGFREVRDEAARVREENNWTAREAARYPDRLVAFCSLDPLRAYAVDELARCASDSRIRGLKLHLTTAFFDFRDVDHVRRLAAVFQAANARRLPIVIHLRTMQSRVRPSRRRDLSERGVDESPRRAARSPTSPDGAGMARRPMRRCRCSRRPSRPAILACPTSTSISLRSPPFPPRRRTSWFSAYAESRLHALAVDRVGTPSQAWESLTRLPLTRDELTRIATNLAPWLRP